MGRWKKILALMTSAALAVSGISVSQDVRAEEGMVTDANLSEEEVEGPADWGALPNEEQLHYMKSELSAFCHFGPNTFNNVEWGESYGTREPSDIFPFTGKFDAEGLVRTVKEAGFGRILLTAKHHDGFCLWDTETTTYDIGHTNYDGDILEELSDACTKYNLDMGCYLSPWDIHEDKYGCFGDNNQTENSAGYTDYNELYIAQIREICTAKKEDGSFKYGNNNPNRRSDRFVEWWMDGAQGGGSNIQTMDWPGIFDVIHESNPGCQIFGTHKAGPTLGSTGGIHWIGNEAGIASDETWAKVNAGTNYEDTSMYTRNGRGINGLPEGDKWSVPEADTQVLNGWFWTDGAPDSTAKSESELGDIYFNSVGHGAVLLLNLSPNKTGAVGEEQRNVFSQFGQDIKDMFSNDLTKQEGVTASATSVWKNAKAYSPDNVLDEKPDGAVYDETYWAPAEGTKTGTLEIDFGKLETFDLVSIEEFIQKGQAIESFSVEYKDEFGSWEKFGEGKTVSSRRLCRKSPVEGSAVRIRILSAKSTPMIHNVGVFKMPEAFEVEENADGIQVPSNLEDISIQEFTLDSSWSYQDSSMSNNASKEEAGSAWSNAQKQGKASFTFTGTQAWVFGKKGSGHGTAQVKIDGNNTEIIDTASDKTLIDTCIYVTPELPYGTHTVELICKTEALGISRAQYADGTGIFEIRQKERGLLYGYTTEVEIVRRAGSKGTAVVSYATRSAGAEQGVNYVHLTDSVTFAEGETSKTITLTGLENERSIDGKDFYFLLMKSEDTSIGASAKTHVTLYTVNPEKILAECREIDPENYKKAGREAFQNAVAELEAFVESSAATENAKKAAAAAAFNAKNDLEERNGYTAEDPYEFPYGLNETKTIEAEKFILDASEAANPDSYVRIAEKNYGTVVDWFEEGNKIRLPFYAAKAGNYKLTAHYRSGRPEGSGNPNAFNWSGTNIVSGTQDVYGENNATQDHTAELSVSVTAAGEGELIFTADSKGGPVIDKFDIQYLDADDTPVAVTGVALDKTEMTIQAGTWCGILTARVMPADAGNKQVTFESSDSEIAAVDAKGSIAVIKGIKDGTAEITVKTEEGSYTAVCTVTVTAEKEEAAEHLQEAVAEAQVYVDAILENGSRYSASMKQIFEAAYQSASDTSGQAGAEVLRERMNELKKAQAGLDLDEAVIKAEAVVKAVEAGQIAYTQGSFGAFVAKYQAAMAAVSAEGYAKTEISDFQDLKTALEEAQNGLVIETPKEDDNPSKEDNNPPNQEKPSVTALSAPANVKAVSRLTGVKITFSKVEHASSYEIYRGGVKIAAVTGSSYTDEKASGGKRLTYTVAAISSNASYTNSARSAAVSLTLPKAVKKLKVKAVKKNVKISFQKVKGAKKYIICRASKKSGPYKKIATLKAKQNSYTDKKAKKGKNFYRVITVKGNAYSPAASKQVTVKK